MQGAFSFCPPFRRFSSNKRIYVNNSREHAGRCPEFRSHNELYSEIQTAAELFLLAVSATGSARKRALAGSRPGK